MISLLTSHDRAVQTQGRNIRTYSDYLKRRSISFASTKIDYVRNGEGRLKKLSVDKGLLRETENVQDQIKALLRCDVGEQFGKTLPHADSIQVSHGRARE